MILSFRITKEQKKALLNVYPNIRFFVEKAIVNATNQIIKEKMYITDEELREYKERSALNGCGPNRKRIVTKETRDKISKSLLATSEKQGWKGMKLLEETRQKLIGHIVSKKTRDNISKANKGQKRSEKQRQNISSGKTGTKYTKKHKQNMSLARVGKKYKRELIN